MNYKEVFQLAQDKGYKLSDVWLRRLNAESEFLELTLIQKWLRDGQKDDSRRVHVFVTPTGYQITSGFFETVKGGKFLPYEQALLEGINKALKLI